MTPEKVKQLKKDMRKEVWKKIMMARKKTADAGKKIEAAKETPEAAREMIEAKVEVEEEAVEAAEEAVEAGEEAVEAGEAYEEMLWGTGEEEVTVEEAVKVEVKAEVEVEVRAEEVAWPKIGDRVAVGIEAFEHLLSLGDTGVFGGPSDVEGEAILKGLAGRVLRIPETSWCLRGNR